MPARRATHSAPVVPSPEPRCCARATPGKHCTKLHTLSPGCLRGPGDLQSSHPGPASLRQRAPRHGAGTGPSHFLLGEVSPEELGQARGVRQQGPGRSAPLPRGPQMAAKDDSAGRTQPRPSPQSLGDRLHSPTASWSPSPCGQSPRPTAVPTKHWWPDAQGPRSYGSVSGKCPGQASPRKEWPGGGQGLRGNRERWLSVHGTFGRRMKTSWN